jgi:hypothetical protein
MFKIMWLILTLKPPDYMERLAGLQREVWDGVDTAEYFSSREQRAGGPGDGLTIHWAQNNQ